MSKVNHVAIGLIPSPFQERLEALSRAKSWYNWGGYISAGMIETVEAEYFAIRNQATLFDITPMNKYRVTGPDAMTVINRVVTRDIRKMRDGRVGYAIWCDEEGLVIDDGTVFRYSDSDFRLCCQERMFSWLLDAAYGFDCQIIDETHEIAALSLQGPTSYSLLKEAGLDVADMKTFDWREIEPDLWISRTGFTGDLGYEIWMPNEQAVKIWDRLWAAGAEWGVRAIGYEALNMVRIEAGFIAAGADFQPQHITQRIHRGRSPLELGFGRMVHFEKGHFNGRRALLKEQAEGSKHHLVKVDIGGFKPADGSLIYHNKKKEVGHITSGTWSPTTKRNIGLAELKAPYGGAVQDNLWVEVYTFEEGVWDKRLQPLEIVEGAFFNNPRSRATPPNAF